MSHTAADHLMIEAYARGDSLLANPIETYHCGHDIRERDLLRASRAYLRGDGPISEVGAARTILIEWRKSHGQHRPYILPEDRAGKLSHY